jgi:hypothetical protein
MKVDTGPGTWENRFCLVVLDVSNPERPDSAAIVATVGASYGDLVVRGGYAYVTRNTQGLQIYDVSNPSEPVMVGSYDTPGFAKDVAVSGDYAYVADGSSLQVINVANPAAPVFVASLATVQSSGVTVAGQTAYVCASSVLLTVDVSNPSVPIKTVTTPVPTLAGVFTSSRLDSGRLYCSLGSGGLCVFSVTNPAAPVFLGALGELGGGSASRVEVAGGRAYLANGSEGLWVVEVGNPASMFITNSWHGTGIVGDVALTAAGVLFAGVGVQGVASFAVASVPVTVALTVTGSTVAVTRTPDYAGWRLASSDDLAVWRDSGDQNPARYARQERQFFKATSTKIEK